MHHLDQLENKTLEAPHRASYGFDPDWLSVFTFPLIPGLQAAFLLYALILPRFSLSYVKSRAQTLHLAVFTQDDKHRNPFVLQYPPLITVGKWSLKKKKKTVKGKLSRS